MCKLCKPSRASFIADSWFLKTLLAALVLMSPVNLPDVDSILPTTNMLAILRCSLSNCCLNQNSLFELFLNVAAYTCTYIWYSLIYTDSPAIPLNTSLDMASKLTIKLAFSSGMVSTRPNSISFEYSSQLKEGEENRYFIF